MLQVGISVGMAIFGVLALMKGRLRVFGKRSITGPAARRIGVLFIIPLLGLGLAYFAGQAGAIQTFRDAEMISGAICWSQIIGVGIAVLMARAQ